MTDPQENPMIAEGQAQMIRQERIPQEEEREERPERCEECSFVTQDYLTGWGLSHQKWCGHPKWKGEDRALPPSLKGEPAEWCPWEEE